MKFLYLKAQSYLPVEAKLGNVSEARSLPVAEAQTAMLEKGGGGAERNWGWVGIQSFSFMS